MTARERPEPVPYVGSRIRAAREAAGMKQADLAQAAGVSRPQVANIEAGVTDPSLGTFVAIVRALKANASDLLAAPNCARCGDRPPVGFTCNFCRLGAS